MHSSNRSSPPRSSDVIKATKGVDVRLVEVGPRDGLQNEPEHTSAEFRAELVNQLSDCGLSTVEVGSFVSPKWVPQMASTDEVLDKVTRRDDVDLVALVPNMIGLDAAVAADVDQIAIFSAATESFSQKNINCSIAQSFERFKPVIEKSRQLNIPVRGYISCVLGCPYEGKVSPEQVVPVVEHLFELGCYEVSLGDTIGVGTISSTRSLLRALSGICEPASIAVHFHDTFGQALPNILIALEHGISVIDSSIGGLGGCPYAGGASGNVATEDVVYMLNGMGVNTGVNLNELLEVSEFVFSYLKRGPASRVASASLGFSNQQ